MSYGCTLVDIEVSQNYSDYDHLIIDNIYWLACFLRVRPKKCDKQLSGLFPFSKLTAMNVLRGNESKWPIGPNTFGSFFGLLGLYQFCQTSLKDKRHNYLKS